MQQNNGVLLQVLEAQCDWKQKMEEPPFNFVVRMSHCVWNESDISNCDRELFVPMLLILHNTRDDGDTLAAEFSKSFLWRRKGVAHSLVPVPRSEYRDWTSVLDVVDRGNLDISAEKRQRVTGLALGPPGYRFV